MKHVGIIRIIDKSYMLVEIRLGKLTYTSCNYYSDQRVVISREDSSIGYGKLVGQTGRKGRRRRKTRQKFSDKANPINVHNCSGV